MHIRIGNQTAIYAGSVERPFAFALAQGFDAFEWFPDRNEAGSGWTEDDLDRDQRASLRETARAHDVLLSVHAPWWANPRNPEALSALHRSAAFAEDIGAVLFNIHLYHEQEIGLFVHALIPLMERLTAAQIRLSFENTPLTGPAECNALFAALARNGWTDSQQLGMCFDIGHANLCQATRNDYLKFVDLLDPRIPIIHLHLHENYGDRDTHLTLFTGPAGRDPSGIEGLLKRLVSRGFSGCIILEQWPEPPTLLCEARNRLLEMIERVTAPLPKGGTQDLKQQVAHSPTKAEDGPTGEPSGKAETGRASPPDFLEVLIEADRRNRSWRERLGWMRDVLNNPETAPTLENLVYLAIYLRFIGTGQIACHEDSRHFRPCHHALLAREIGERLAAITTSQNIHVVRRIIPWLPSSGSEFTRSEPLTLIRDIAHRNDIPRELKTEIKETLQNKLHRCAGPEDLVTSAAILARITASGGDYAPAFVAQFRQFHEQLREFFGARSLEEQLEAMAGPANDPDSRLIRAFLEAKGKPAADPPHQLSELRLLTEVRERFQARLPEREGTDWQRLQLVDIRLEDYAFVLLSQLNRHFDRSVGHDRKGIDHEAVTVGSFWQPLLECLFLTVANLRCSGFERDECRAVQAELDAWRQCFAPIDREQVLRLRATLERSRRFADKYRDIVLRLFPQGAARLGQALGVPEPAIKFYAESEIRSHVVFQLAKLLTLSLKALRELAGLPPWEVIVPGNAVGVLTASPSIEALPYSKHPAVVLIDRVEGDEEIPRNVTGIIVAHETPFLSHFAVRAREHGVVFVSCEDDKPLSAVKSMTGRRAVLKTSPGNVDISLLGDEDLLPTAPQPPDERSKPLDGPAVELCEAPPVLSLDCVTMANAGGKAYGARLIEELSGRGNATFRTPPSLVIPFGTMAGSFRSQPSAAKEYQRCVELLDHLPVKELPETLERLWSLIRSLKIPDAVVDGAIERFGAGTRLMVRSSASCEDRAETGGAGLYESVTADAGDGLADAVRKVWASLWSLRATTSRRNAGMTHDGVFMAVLIQQLVTPDLSFIMHTVNPVNSNHEELLVELVVGLGQTLASADRPGNPYRLVGNKSTGELRMLAFANFSEAVFPGEQGGPFAGTIDYSQVNFSVSASCRGSLGRQLIDVGRCVENALGTPQDIEGVVAGDTIFLVQSRPQQGTAGSTSRQK